MEQLKQKHIFKRDVCLLIVLTELYLCDDLFKYQQNTVSQVNQ